MSCTILLLLLLSARSSVSPPLFSARTHCPCRWGISDRLADDGKPTFPAARSRGQPTIKSYQVIAMMSCCVGALPVAGSPAVRATRSWYSHWSAVQSRR